jgi:hypothetical protein
MNPVNVEKAKKFFEAFKVEVDSMASQTLVYNEDINKVSYDDTDVYGETEIIRLQTEDGQYVIEFKGDGEIEQVEEWVVAFAELNYDVEAFIQKVQEEHQQIEESSGLSLKRWHTLLELKENHKSLGLKGWVFFIVDFPINLETNVLEYVIAQPTFTGVGVTTGILSYTLKREKISEMFTVSKKTFEEYAKELEADYFKP